MNPGTPQGQVASRSLDDSMPGFPCWHIYDEQGYDLQIAKGSVGPDTSGVRDQYLVDGAGFRPGRQPRLGSASTWRSAAQAAPSALWGAPGRPALNRRPRTGRPGLELSSALTAFRIATLNASIQTGGR